MKARTFAAIAAAAMTVCGASAAQRNYLRFTARGGTVRIGMTTHNVTAKNPALPLTLEWTDSPDAEPWTPFEAGSTAVALGENKTAWFRQYDPERKALSDADTFAGWHFTMTADGATPSATVEAAGNCLSIVDATCEGGSVAANALSYLFSRCTVLATPPELPATNVETSACSHMFYGCTALTSPPKLPATKIGTSCYAYMFYGCAKLETAPALPARSLAASCYSYMFKNCTSLVFAPHLPAATLAKGCYQSMFDGCEKLARISVAFTNWNAGDNSTKEWVENVPAGGRFIKPAALASTTGISNIPTGWTTYAPLVTTVPKTEGLSAVAVVDGQTIMPTLAANGLSSTFTLCSAESDVGISVQPEEGYVLVRLAAPVADQSAALQIEGLTVGGGQATLSFGVKTTAALDSPDWQPATISDAALSPDGKTVTLTIPATAAQGYYKFADE